MSLLQKRMLSKQDESEEAEVRREDQDRINRFSTLHRRVNAIETELKAKQKEKEDLEEISLELELSSDDNVSYKIGDSFVSLPLPKAQALLARSVEAVDAGVAKLESDLDVLQGEMTGLKDALYARFGRSINLEA